MQLQGSHSFNTCTYWWLSLNKVILTYLPCGKLQKLYNVPLWKYAFYQFNNSYLYYSTSQLDTHCKSFWTVILLCWFVYSDWKLNTVPWERLNISSYQNLQFLSVKHEILTQRVYITHQIKAVSGRNEANLHIAYFDKLVKIFNVQFINGYHWGLNFHHTP